jgi:hypothetical protein
MRLRAFLITPFSADRAGNENPEVFATVQAAVRDAARSADVDLVHPAETGEAGAIMQQVEREIRRADIVLAILTGLNPNVMLELGLAKRESAILIIDSATKLPFDVRHLRQRCLWRPGRAGDIRGAAGEGAARNRRRGGAGTDRKLNLRSIFAGLLAEHASRSGSRGRARGASESLSRPGQTLHVADRPPGFGKTALLAAFVAGEPDVCAYHFFAPAHVPESVAEDSFLRSIVQQMASWHGEAIEPARLLPELRARFHMLASTPLESPRVLYSMESTRSRRGG